MASMNASTLTAIAQRYHGGRAETQSGVFAAIGPILQSTLDRYGITIVLRAAHFLAQMCHECMDFTAMEENGTADYFKKYDGKLGNDQPGDGERYKGRGLIQLTGKSNYALYGGLIGVNLVDDPEAAADPKTALIIACEFWKRLGLNTLADQDDIIDITKRINGGLNGLEQRRAYLATAKNVLTHLAAGDIADDRPAPLTQPILHRGDTVAEVADLQKRLNAAGYAVTVDGDFGAGTETAVRQLQTNKGLAPDGIVGPATWAKLPPG